ncbi:MAG: hypothetical protein R2704_18315 [Microthrixaceae bacterium]
MRLGVAHHLGWAVVVAAGDDHEVVDRRRIELVEPGVSTAPIHHDGGPHELHRVGPPLGDAALAKLVAEVRASAGRASSASLDRLERELDGPIVSLSVRDWPQDHPSDLATLRRAPYESRADSVMYCQVLAELARDRGWDVHRFDAKTVEAAATERLGDRAEAVLHGPRSVLGPPWAKDHRVALAATVMAAKPAATD